MKTLLSPRELARAIGASESSLKRWADQGQIKVSRTSGGHRRIAIQDALRFVRDNQLAVIRPELLGLTNLSGDQTADTDTDRYLSLLLDGRSREAGSMLVERYLAGDRVEELCDGFVRDAMHRVGELWLRDFGDGVMREHRATDTCVAAVSQLRFAVETSDAPRCAVGGAPTGDPYILPSMMAATVLASLGYRTVNLGPETPFEVLVRSMHAHQPDIVWLSISGEGLGDGLGRQLEQLRADARAIGAGFIVGGREVPRGVAGGASATMSELAAFVRGLTAADPEAKDGLGG